MNAHDLTKLTIRRCEWDAATGLYAAVISFCGNEEPWEGDPKRPLWNAVMAMHEANRWARHQDRPSQQINDQAVLEAVLAAPGAHYSDLSSDAYDRGARYGHGFGVLDILERHEEAGRVKKLDDDHWQPTEGQT